MEVLRKPRDANCSSGADSRSEGSLPERHLLCCFGKAPEMAREHALHEFEEQAGGHTGAAARKSENRRER